MASLYKRERADGSFVYWLRFERDGKLIRENCHTDNRQKAEKILRSRLNAVDEGVEIEVNPRRVTYQEIRADLVRYYTTTGKRDEQEYTKRLAHLDPYFKDYRAAAITGDAITKYIEHRQSQTVHRIEGDRPTSNGTVNRELLVLSKMMNLARQNRKLVHVPAISKLKEAPPRSGFVSVEQFEKIRKHLTPDLQVVAVLGFTYGMRLGEILGLDWSNVDFDAREIRLEVGTTKNDDGRTLPFTDEVEVLLAEQRARVASHVEAFPERKIPACVFPVLPGAFAPKALIGQRRGGFEHAWAKATAAAGLPGILFHDLRRSAVRNLIRAGVSQSVAQTISGHRSANIFARYNIVSPDDRRDAMAKVRAFQLNGGGQ